MSKFDVRDAATKLAFEITHDDVASPAAVRKNPAKCIIAQGIRHSLPQVVDAYVCASVTVLTMVRDGKKIKVRYKTPTALRKGLNNWDVGMDWKLPLGEYSLLPCASSVKSSVAASRSKPRAKRPRDSGRYKTTPLNPRRIAILEDRGN
jgi:hypothetical protein